ncbi:MAG: metallophosphoesterase [bacterium]|nr:metallophosphoesterase [bacterium]
MRIAAIGDLHCKSDSAGMIRQLLKGVDREADILLLAGDITNLGLVEEMEVLLDELSFFSLPKVAVIGNHDHESNQIELLIKMMTESGILVLDGTSCLIDKVGIVGTKGFCGGFGKLHVQPFGEQALKNFIKTSINEASRIDKALAELNCPFRVAAMHYAPIKETLLGEEIELYPFLGSSLFADVFDRHKVDVVVHAHAHHGSPYALTPGGIPVHNVSRFVQSRFGHRDWCLLTVGEEDLKEQKARIEAASKDKTSP